MAKGVSRLTFTLGSVSRQFDSFVSRVKARTMEKLQRNRIELKTDVTGVGLLNLAPVDCDAAGSLRKGAPRRGTGQQTDTSRLCVGRRTRRRGFCTLLCSPFPVCPSPRLFTVCKHGRTTFQRRLHFTARKLPTVRDVYTRLRVHTLQKRRIVQIPFSLE